jgi:CheY-like chemotaxis protein
VRRIQLFGRQRQDAAAEAVDLDQLCLDTVELTRGRWRHQAEAASGGIRVVLELGAPPEAHGRAAELREVLTNLIFNAADAMPHGGVITLRTETQGEWVCLAVCDTGVGISPDVQRRIFEPFFTTKGEGGTGLGLAVSYGIVQAYNGEIAVESVPGSGSTFIIRLPRAEAARTEAAPARPMAARPARVLVLEDDPVIAELLAAILERDGHEVVLAGDGHEGMECLDDGAFALVLSDVAMPELSGWDVARAVHEREPDTPIVFVSGWGETLDPAQLAAHGVRSVVPKPFCIADVRAAIASALSA